jgi:hypothetical protein
MADGGSVEESKAVRTRVRRLVRAPYDLFFGRVLLDAAHRSADERIRYVRNNTDKI